jgi:hypothetical protein
MSYHGGDGGVAGQRAFAEHTDGAFLGGALYLHMETNNPEALESSVTGSINPDLYTAIVRESTAQADG